MASKLEIGKEGRQCTKCLILKPWDNFYKEKSKRYGHATICSVCFIQLKKESDASISRAKENRIDGQRFKKHEEVKERMTTPHPVIEYKPYWDCSDMVEIGTNPIPALYNHIK